MSRLRKKEHMIFQQSRFTIRMMRFSIHWSRILVPFTKQSRFTIRMMRFLIHWSRILVHYTRTQFHVLRIQINRDTHFV